jgi:WD40 repeat protein
VWDAASGQELLTLFGHTDTVSGVAFSPDGTRLATTSWDKTVKVWNVASGQELLTLSGHTERVKRIAFSPDGTRLVTASEDGTVRVYTLDIEELMGLAQQRVTRSLRPEECQKYLHQEQCPPTP